MIPAVTDPKPFDNTPSSHPEYFWSFAAAFLILWLHWNNFCGLYSPLEFQASSVALPTLTFLKTERQKKHFENYTWLMFNTAKTDFEII